MTLKTAAIIVMILSVTITAIRAGDLTCRCDQHSEQGQCAPAGGWSPYCGGVLHWWPKCCFPCCGGPDDYCRKPLPNVCWPKYPHFYSWGTPNDPSCGHAR